MSETKRPRGRPPTYDRETALAAAGDAFWRTGYAATTLDDLCDATGMNRPSLYAAFGDKHGFYLAVLDRYAAASIERLADFLERDLPLATQLAAVYDAALSIYLEGDDAARGCFLVGTAVTEASDDATVRDRLRSVFDRIDGLFEARFARARANGEIDVDAEPRALAQVASGLLNALAVRARSGASRDSLRRTARQAVALLAPAS